MLLTLVSQTQTQICFTLVLTIWYDQDHTVEIDGKIYYVMSDEGLKTLEEFKFMNIKKKYNYFYAMFAQRSDPKVINFVNERREFFAKSAFAAAFVDHQKFLSFLYQ